MGIFTDPYGREIDGYANVVRYVPRQIPTDTEAKVIEAIGNTLKASGAAIGVTSFIVSLILAASMN